MVGAVGKLVRQYGSTMMLVRDGVETEIRAFLQETRSKSQSGTQREFNPLGEVPKGMFVYIGPAEEGVCAGNSLIWQGRSFEFRRAEPVMLGDDVLYYWGLCLEKGGEESWGS